MSHRKLLSLIAAAACLVASFIALPSAQAETITGQFRYLDSGGVLRPIAHARVEIWRGGPGFLGVWGWSSVATVTTDALGRINHPLPFVGTGAYGVRVFAQNYAAYVQAADLASPFWQEPGQPGPIVNLPVNTGTETLDFSFDFIDPFATMHYNLAETIRHGFDYASARRAPGETDVIGTATVWPHHTVSDTHGTYFNPIFNRIEINNWHTSEDFIILHEYAHYLESTIGSFLALATVHDGCNINSGSLQYDTIAWMEGFADYFAQAVNATLPSGTLAGTPGRGTLDMGTLESPPPCPHAGDTVENFVAAALWDLADSNNEGFDVFCGRDTEVFHIFDRDLDNLPAATWPTIDMFATAWLNRGHDYPQLATMFTSIGLSPPGVAAVPGYDTDSRADIAVYRPDWASTWHIVNSSTGTSNARFWGTWGDIPTEADFDGDGVIDVAVWRPSTGDWHVIKSGSGGAATAVQWGTAGDIPVPGDYDGDGEADFAIYRPSTGEYWVHEDLCGSSWGLGVGLPGEVPAVADYDDDGADDFGMYQPADGWFWVWPAAGTGWIYNSVVAGGVPVSGDYTGDGRADMAVYRSSLGRYDVRSSSTNAISGVTFGALGDKPVPDDYNGDGRIDMATYRPSTGLWTIRNSGAGTTYFTWGISTDTPTPGK